ncbi:MFS transporter [Streptacidiphilus jiangxiensis]|uniref:Predicted arabinose efflux permease, MFS family n=1 Tax=Streptacidiphilus jiangxiensis TaxID=235985 RepID=A0A1H7VPV4_STRJI|nr:MFS transporter [Streptacidiphilus jiangxiensis]SEM10827.1 Predicted arabinose efflux permease, MFS family [Streptacidiphilus jiangxiensis]
MTPPGGPSLWRNRNFVLLWGGQTVSEAGTAVTTFALPYLAVVTLHRSTLEVAALQVFATLPFILFALPAGALIERASKRRVMIWTDLARALVLLTVPLAAGMHALGMPQLYLVATVSGVLSVLFGIAYPTLVPALVEPAQLADGNSKLQISTSVAQITGASVGGVLLAALGAVGAVVVDACSFVVSCASLVGVRGDMRRPAARTARLSVREDIAEGLRVIWRDRILRALLLNGGTSVLFSTMTSALFVLFLVRDLHGAPTVVGVVQAAGGVGGVLGGVLAPRLVRRFGNARVILHAKLWFSGAFALLPCATPGWGLLVAGAVGFAGFAGVVVFNTAAISLRQQMCPPELQGRMNATFRWVVWGGMPLGAMLGGLLGTRLGVRETILLAGLGSLSGAFWLWRSPLRTLSRTPEPAAEQAVPVSR